MEIHQKCDCGAYCPFKIDYQVISGEDAVSGLKKAGKNTGRKGFLFRKEKKCRFPTISEARCDTFRIVGPVAVVRCLKRVEFEDETGRETRAIGQADFYFACQHLPRQQ